MLPEIIKLYLVNFNLHEVLVNRLGGLSLPRKSVVRLTDRPMTLDVYRGRKTTLQQQQQPLRGEFFSKVIHTYIYIFIYIYIYGEQKGYTSSLLITMNYPNVIKAFIQIAAHS